MQSLASLMSIKQNDIGNLDDFNDSDDEVSKERRSNFGTGQVTYVTGKTCEDTTDSTRLKMTEDKILNF